MEAIVIGYNPFTVEYRCGGKSVRHEYEVVLLPAEIMREAQMMTFPDPEPVMPKVEPVYQVRVITPEAEIVQQELTFREATLIQGVVSEMFGAMKWTRQPAVDSIVRHGGFVLDMYNEGYVMIQLDSAQ